MKRLLAPLLLAVGCAGVPKTAIVDGKEVPRLTQEFHGQPFTIKHEGAHPQPGGPSSGLRDAGGAIRGRVCGMLFDLDVMHKGDHVQVVGSVDNHMPMAIDLSEANGVRHFTGNLGTAGVDFTVEPGLMQGHVGIRVFSMEAAGDGFEGHMRIPGLLGDGAIGIMIHGRDALFAMTPAAQAAVLPAMITCNPGGGQFTMMEGLVIGFGGEATDRPPETSSVYTRH
jgi:hypothetical protein